jgi:acetoin utilization deacetylase AcuC-like enzyme
MTLLYSSEQFLRHDTGHHPEHAGRLTAVHARLAEAGLVQQCECVAWQPASVADLQLVHEAEYPRLVAEFAARGGGRIESDTVMSAASYEVAALAAGAVVDAVRRVVAGPDRTALCLVRPPGHHALAHAPMGFCLFNNVAIGARIATQELKLNRVLIVDWDVHHGNGTQDMFWTDPQVAFFSSHRWPFYPGSGDHDEKGAGDGLGATLNLPTTFGTPRKEFLTRFRTRLEGFADRMKPELVLISAGFDAHHADPVGALGLESEDFAELTEIVAGVARTHASGRMVSVLEGGYNPEKLAESVEFHLSGLLSS